jgi:cytochrome c oxidase assembly factor CtaG
MGFLLRGDNWPLGWPLVALVVACVLYFQGPPPKPRRAFAFVGGLLTIAIAVASPIDAYAGRLFWVHMTQHVLLTMVAPPLILLGRPWPRVFRPVPLRVRRPVARAVLAGTTLGPARRAARWLGGPLPAFALFNLTLLAWHLPVLYDLTLRNGVVHDFEHALFFTTALVFWVHLLPGATGRPALADGVRVAYGTGALLVSWVLAVVIGLATQPIYAHYASLGSRPTGISALADQQLAAGVMWVPGSIPYLIVLFIAAFRWLDPSASSRRRHHLGLQPREIS